MKLMRHSDIKLTSKVYTDESQVPIYDAIKDLPRLVEHTQIRAQISDGVGRCLSQDDAKREGDASEEMFNNGGFGRAVAHFVASRQTGAGEGNRTPVCSLGSCRSTIELHPRGEE